MYEIGSATNEWTLNENKKTLSAHGFEWKVIGFKTFNYQGKERKVIHVQKPRGKKYFGIVLYENGMISSATPY